MSSLRGFDDLLGGLDKVGWLDKKKLQYTGRMLSDVYQDLRGG